MPVSVCIFMCVFVLVLFLGEHLFHRCAAHWWKSTWERVTENIKWRNLSHLSEKLVLFFVLHAIWCIIYLFYFLTVCVLLGYSFWFRSYFLYIGGHPWGTSSFEPWSLTGTKWLSMDFVTQVSAGMLHYISWTTNLLKRTLIRKLCFS